jgi:predicted ATP-grasp superfamily ATP-dependent carboligase
MRALIIESGYTRGALAGCRALAQAGWTVGIGSPRRDGLAATSKYADRWHEVPRIELGLEIFLEATERAVREGGYEVILCSEDATALGLSSGRNQLSATVPYPPNDVVMRAFDKLELHRAAERVGMRTPRTVPADEQAIADVHPPVLVKSRLHWTPGAQRAPARLEAALCSSRAQVRSRVNEIRSHGGEAILQEFVRGDQVHYLAVVDQTGEVIAGVQTSSPPAAVPRSGRGAARTISNSSDRSGVAREGWRIAEGTRMGRHHEPDASQAGRGRRTSVDRLQRKIASVH